MRYRLSPLAEQDIREIWSYVADESSMEQADRLVDTIVDRFEMLAEQPRAGRRRHEFGRDVRSFAVQSYVIYYQDNDNLRISRVLHGRRDQAAAWHETSSSGDDA